MSTISNRFFVTALEDGTTLHGALRSSSSLSQAYGDGGCVPDWTNAGPVIYVSLINGAEAVAADSGGTWYYNGTAIIWDANGLSSNDTFTGVFKLIRNHVVSNITVPAIQIVKNLATSENKDHDIISYTGQKTLSTAPIPFSCETEVRITQWISGGYLGELYFVDGIADLTETNRMVTIGSRLYSDHDVSDYSALWYINEEPVTSTDDEDDAYIDDGMLVVKDTAVVDYATIKCMFYYGGDNVAVAYVGVDDTHDPEYLWIFLGEASGSSASLRRGESATFKVWVGTADDTTVNPSWNTFKVLLLDAQGDPISDPIGTEAVDENNYHTMTNYPASGTFQYATMTIPYDKVFENGKSMTGIILATQTTT